MSQNIFKNQVLPLIATVVTFFVLVFLLWSEIKILNRFTKEDILLPISLGSILVGLTIYLKTSIDFAIYIGKLMEKNNTWRSRIAIEIGTGLGNALGTMVILVIWAFFKEVKILLALMVFIASLVLFRLAEEGLHHALEIKNAFPTWFEKMIHMFGKYLESFNTITGKVLKYVIPNTKIKDANNLNFAKLFVVSFTVPFILGLDDFAGYISLFNVVNVFSFAIGVFLGHMILNIFLYISPSYTIKLVKIPIISLLGTIAFVGLGLWGLYEVVHMIL